MLPTPGNGGPPILTLLMDDHYDAVRFIANRSLKSMPGYQDVGFDFRTERNERHGVIRAIMGRWSERLPTRLANRAQKSRLPPMETSTPRPSMHTSPNGTTGWFPSMNSRLGLNSLPPSRNVCS